MVDPFYFDYNRLCVLEHDSGELMLALHSQWGLCSA